MVKTLADLKRDLIIGKKVRLIYRRGQQLNSLREVIKTTTTGIKFKALDETKAGWLDYPKASLLEYDGKTIRVYLAGHRNLTNEEQRIIDNEPRDAKTEGIDMLTDTNIMFYRKEKYYQDMKKAYLFGTGRQAGKRLTYKDGKPQIEDDEIKGELILVYEIV